MDEDRGRWDTRWRERGQQEAAPEPWLAGKAGFLPPGAVLDVACGQGRHALHLAARGWTVTALDVSPVALAALHERAAALGLDVATVARDLDDPAALDDLGPFAGIVVVRYKPDAAQWRRLASRLAPGGLLLLLSFGREKARSGFNPRFCLDEAELRETLAGLLECVAYERLGPEQDHLEGSLWRRPEAR
ncbi:class I SAM-dependent methyltransferase [Marinimicrococcus flavescens]|uniref:Methyltransferase domain-containing protein n=1 Tax=Marinimicrococcus flavescens TaxID=3031815 RepID=A0AAP3XTC3_9PROT|nr:methyltransferase domain-containing protein [Marinimicrococcus flavescens]